METTDADRVTTDSAVKEFSLATATELPVKSNYLHMSTHSDTMDKAYLRRDTSNILDVRKCRSAVSCAHCHIFLHSQGKWWTWVKTIGYPSLKALVLQTPRFSQSLLFTETQEKQRK